MSNNPQRHDASSPIDWPDQVQSLVELGWYTNNGPKVQLLEKVLADSLGAKYCVCVCTFELAVIGLLLSKTADNRVIRATTGISSDLLRSLDLFGFERSTLHLEESDTPCNQADFVLLDAGLPTEELARSLPELHAQVFLDLSTLSTPLDCRDRIAALRGHLRGAFLDTSKSPFISTGQGGAFLTDDLQLANLLKTMRNHHASETFSTVNIRFNIKMSEIQALRGLLTLGQRMTA
jgi:hypothetical protein